MRRLRLLLSVNYVLVLGACLIAVVLTVVALGSSGSTTTVAPAASVTATSGGSGAPTTAQVFGCGGALSGNPLLCAGLNRHVAQLPTSGQSSPARFYKAAPANYDAEFWHLNAINGKQYGFPYDDDANQSSDISVTHPQYMIIAVGW